MDIAQKNYWRSVDELVNSPAFEEEPSKEIAEEIKKHYPEFTIDYNPDFRQKIADSWPASIDDAHARADWGWQNDFTIENMTEDMFANLKAYVYNK
jgi:nucleoside-diphosphate-sugar epimerase